MTAFLKNGISRRTVLGAGLATAGLLAMPSILQRAGQVAEGRRLWRLLQEIVRREHLPGIHQGDRHRRRIDRRTDRRSLAGAARAGGEGRAGAGRRFDDVADFDA